MKSIEEKRQREKEMVSLMISLYCRKKHKTKRVFVLSVRSFWIMPL